MGHGHGGATSLSRKPSALRKNMAWLLGPPPADPPVRLAPGMGDSPSLGAEKNDSGSAIWGAAGDGNEWDVDGSAASFWKRFSMAQRHAQDKSDPLTRQSEKYVRSQQQATRTMRSLVIVAIIVVIGLAVGLGVGIPLSHHKSADSHSSSSSSSGARSEHSKRALLGGDFEHAARQGGNHPAPVPWEPIPRSPMVEEVPEKKSIKLEFGQSTRGHPKPAHTSGRKSHRRTAAALTPQQA